jgi:hypothetical protein
MLSLKLKFLVVANGIANPRIKTESKMEHESNRKEIKKTYLEHELEP